MSARVATFDLDNIAGALDENLSASEKLPLAIKLLDGAYQNRRVKKDKALQELYSRGGEQISDLFNVVYVNAMPGDLSDLPIKVKAREILAAVARGVDELEAM